MLIKFIMFEEMRKIYNCNYFMIKTHINFCFKFAHFL